MTLSSRVTSTVTHTVASLASSSGRTVGRASTAYDNTTNKDEQIGGAARITTGTTPTAGIIEVWAFQELEDGTWPDIFTSAYSGTDGGFTVKSRDVLRAGAVLLGSVATDTTSNRAYDFQARDLARLFGVLYVRKVAFWATHSTVAALNSTTGNHKSIILPAYYA